MTVTRVLVTSDTHLNLGARLPDELLRLVDMADHVLHCGDVVRGDVLDTLAALAPLTAVRGNCDRDPDVGHLPDRAKVVIDGVRFGLMHDAGSAAGRHSRLVDEFSECDVVAYGHTHSPEVVRVARGDRPVYVLNPGSPTQRRRSAWHSACWVELAGEIVIDAQLVHLDAP